MKIKTDKTAALLIILLAAAAGFAQAADVATHVYGAKKMTLNSSTDTVNAGYYAATTLHAMDADLAAENIKSGVTIFGIPGTYMGPPPSVPQNLTVLTGNQQITLNWSAPASYGGSPITNYKIYRSGAPGNETYLVTIGNVLTYIDTGLTNDIPYYYKVSAVSDSGESSQSNEAYATPSAAPAAGGEWVLVPGSATLGTSDFYVMKYEAKNVGGVATSQADVTPWVSITQTAAISACSALGSGYHLLTIAETQTINRNIEAQAANWANGTIGSLVSVSGGLKRGNVGITDSASYNGSDPDYGATPSAERILKAKLVLSAGGEIWDWSGNVWEWIYGAGTNGILGAPSGVAFYATAGWIDWNDATNLNEERPVLGPSNSSWTGDYGVGRYYGGAATNAVLRGGFWNTGATAGVFAFTANYAPSFSDGSTGFRCGR